MSTYTGFLREVGPDEIGASGKSKPRKIVIASSPDPAVQGKTFRVWANEPAFASLSAMKPNDPVTVEFVEEQRQGPQGPYTQNKIQQVLLDGHGGTDAPLANGNAWAANTTGPDWSQSAAAPPAASGSAPVSKDDYWARREAKDEERTLEIEAAWGIQTAITTLGVAEMNPNKIQEKAMQLVMLKRAVAQDLAK